MATFPLPRFLEPHDERTRHGRTLAQIATQTDTNATTIRQQHTAADSKTLRGIPAIGRGIAGVITGTDPMLETIHRLIHQIDPR